MSPTATINPTTLRTGESLTLTVQDLNGALKFHSDGVPGLYKYLVESEARGSATMPFYRSDDSWSRSTRYKGLASGRLTALNVEVAEWVEQATEAYSNDYLFEETVPEVVPAEWLAMLHSAHGDENPDFVMPWNSESPPG